MDGLTSLYSQIQVFQKSTNLCCFVKDFLYTLSKRAHSIIQGQKHTTIKEHNLKQLK